jgi:hypothetical protein
VLGDHVHSSSEILDPPDERYFQNVYYIFVIYGDHSRGDWYCTPALHLYSNGKGIPVTGREGPLGCERSRLPDLLYSHLIDGGKVVSLTRRPPFTPQEDSSYSFLLEVKWTLGP